MRDRGGFCPHLLCRFGAVLGGREGFGRAVHVSVGLRRGEVGIDDLAKALEELQEADVIAHLVQTGQQWLKNGRPFGTVQKFNRVLVDGE